MHEENCFLAATVISVIVDQRGGRGMRGRGCDGLPWIFLCSRLSAMHLQLCTVRFSQRKTVRRLRLVFELICLIRLSERGRGIFSCFMLFIYFIYLHILYFYITYIWRIFSSAGFTRLYTSRFCFTAWTGYPWSIYSWSTAGPFNPLMPNRYNCTYLLFLVLRSNRHKSKHRPH